MQFKDQIYGIVLTTGTRLLCILVKIEVRYYIYAVLVYIGARSCMKNNSATYYRYRYYIDCFVLWSAYRIEDTSMQGYRSTTTIYSTIVLSIDLVVP